MIICGWAFTRGLSLSSKKPACSQTDSQLLSIISFNLFITEALFRHNINSNHWKKNNNNKNSNKKSSHIFINRAINFVQSELTWEILSDKQLEKKPKTECGKRLRRSCVFMFLPLSNREGLILTWHPKHEFVLLPEAVKQWPPHKGFSAS